jgi:hypothetical protein
MMGRYHGSERGARVKSMLLSYVSNQCKESVDHLFRLRLDSSTSNNDQNSRNSPVANSPELLTQDMRRHEEFIVSKTLISGACFTSWLDHLLNSSLPHRTSRNRCQRNNVEVGR